MAGLDLKHVAKSYGAINVIKNIDLDIEDGEFVVFVGPSGCGKSTLLRMIAGLEEISGAQFLSAGLLSMMLPLPSAVWRWCSRLMRCTRI